MSRKPLETGAEQTRRLTLGRADAHVAVLRVEAVRVGAARRVAPLLPVDVNEAKHLCRGEGGARINESTAEVSAWGRGAATARRVASVASHLARAADVLDHEAHAQAGGEAGGHVGPERLDGADERAAQVHLAREPQPHAGAVRVNVHLRAPAAQHANVVNDRTAQRDTSDAHPFAACALTLRSTSMAADACTMSVSTAAKGPSSAASTELSCALNLAPRYTFQSASE